MSSISIEKITEEKVKTSSGNTENKVQITFKTLKSNTPVVETITLAGEGSVKALISV